MEQINSSKTDTLISEESLNMLRLILTSLRTFRNLQFLLSQMIKELSLKKSNHQPILSKATKMLILGSSSPSS